MKKFFVLFILLWFCVFKTIGQTYLPPVYEIRNDTALSTTLLPEYWKILEDKENKLTIEQVSRPLVANEFHFNKTKDDYFNYSIHTYWFCYRLRNAMNHDAEIGFGSDYDEQTGNLQSTYYFYCGGKWSKFENGLFSKWKKLKGLVLNNYVPAVLKPGEELIVYVRVHNIYLVFWAAPDFPIVFHSNKNMSEKNDLAAESMYVTGIHNSILFGILLFAFLFNFFLFLIVKQRVYFYLAIYALSAGFLRTSNESYIVFFRETRVLWALIYDSYFGFWSNMFFLALFIRSLLNTAFYLPVWDRFLKWLSLFGLISAFLPYISTFFSNGFGVRQLEPNEVFAIYSCLGVLLHICILATFFVILSDKRSSPSKTITISILPALCVYGIGWSIYAIYSSFHFAIFSVNFSNWWLDKEWYFIETICLSWLVITFSWVLLQRFRQLQKEIAYQAFEKEREKNLLIEQKRIELENTVEERTAELKLSLENLQSTQKQLIQSEKMAALGEMTAGIAHEIQNPLNFVNNFSEVNNELLHELEEEIDKGNIKEAKAIAHNIINNEQKITQHGQRADGIVKGMLQHSRASVGQKEPSDINALADEYLRLAYHGLRAKDKSFNATMLTDFDPTIERINIIPQDIGRVLLNLYNNAFYAVSEKTTRQIQNYEPTVSVKTKKVSGRVEIRVRDNGNGIPQKVLDKIFQPFFTTKPAGQGTGLGLSMSYDTIKGHGGEIKVETKEGEGAEFVIDLPINNV